MDSSFTVNDEYVEAEVYKETTVKGVVVFLVKVKFLEIGLYINSIRVQESPKFPERGMWVQLPVSTGGGRYYKVMECDGSSPFLEMVTRKSQRAVKDYLASGSSNDTESDGSIDLDKIPF